MKLISQYEILNGSYVTDIADPRMTSGVAAVDRAISVIDAFQSGESSLTLQKLAERTGLHKSTIIRLIASLERGSIVIKRGQGEYALGPALLKYGSRYQSSLRLSDQLVPVLSELMNATGQTSAFFVRDGNSRVCLHMAESYSVLRSHLRVGSVQPILPSGSGQILLAYSSDPAEAASGEAVRRSLVVLNKGQRHPEISSLAAPVLGYGDVLVGAITVSGPTGDYNRKQVAVFSKPLLEAAMTLTERLGGNFPTGGQ